MAYPVRTCAGCGRTASRVDLVRFVAVEGRLQAGARLPGRGVYTCRRLECFESAVERRAFSRSLRLAVQVEPALRRLYTDDDG